MDPNSNSKEIVIDFSPFFRIFKDGTIHRLMPLQFAPTSDDHESAVRSKDVVIHPESNVSVRIYVPKKAEQSRKLPVMVYIHGGAFCMGSAKSPTFHNFVSSLVEKSNVVGVSVDYRLAPENPIQASYDDACSAFQWLALHVESKGPDAWLNEYADVKRVFLGGESAGANIAHDVAIRAGSNTTLLHGVEIVGLFLVHPYFGGKDVDKLYKFLCPESSARDDDPRLNPAVDLRLREMPVKRVLFCLAEKDFLRERGRAYYEGLKRSEWKGEVEIMETEGEGHAFHLFDMSKDKSKDLVDRLAQFLNQD